MKESTEERSSSPTFEKVIQQDPPPITFTGYKPIKTKLKFKYFLRKVIARIEKIPEESSRWGKLQPSTKRGSKNDDTEEKDKKQPQWAGVRRVGGEASTHLCKSIGAGEGGGGGDPENMGEASPHLDKSLEVYNSDFDTNFEEQLLEVWLKSCETRIFCIELAEECIKEASNRRQISEPAEEVTITAPPPTTCLPPTSAENPSWDLKNSETTLIRGGPGELVEENKQVPLPPTKPKTTKLILKAPPPLKKVPVQKKKTMKTKIVIPEQEKKKFEQFFMKNKPPTATSNVTLTKNEKINLQPKVTGSKVGNLLKFFQSADDVKISPKNIPTNQKRASNISNISEGSGNLTNHSTENNRK